MLADRLYFLLNYLYWVNTYLSLKTFTKFPILKILIHYFTALITTHNDYYAESLNF